MLTTWSFWTTYDDDKKLSLQQITEEEKKVDV
jgi:hypothetical protein